MSSTQSTHSRGPEGYKPPRSTSSTQLQNPESNPTFLKIPRIRLKQKQEKKSPVSPPPLDQKNNKFSYIENSHLVNPVMIQQQQQKILQQKRGGQEGRSQFSDDDEEEFGNGEVTKSGRVLIKPKKLPNPIKESVAMQSIHKELLLNQKIGRSVLNHKTELQKALEKLATKNVDSDNNAELEKHSNAGPNPPSLPHFVPQQSVVSHNNKNEFQRILDARAKQIEDQKCFVDGVTKRPVIRESEFEKIHKRITSSVQK